MAVDRLSIEGLRKIVAGKVREDATCVIKFYSNHCEMCHNLKDYYEDISNNDEYENIHFFAFNVDSYPAIEKQLSFNGVPTISLIKTYTSQRKPKIRILADPSDPSEKTWYKSSDITDFIGREK